MKKLLKTIWQNWEKIASFIGKVQTAIILSLIYYLIITPFGILAQLYQLVTQKKINSYWSKREKDPSKLVDFYKQY